LFWLDRRYDEGGTHFGAGAQLLLTMTMMCFWIGLFRVLMIWMMMAMMIWMMMPQRDSIDGKSSSHLRRMSLVRRVLVIRSLLDHVFSVVLSWVELG
jgi:hypothetical protein